MTATIRWAIPIALAILILALFVLTARHGGHPVAGAHFHS